MVNSVIYCVKPIYSHLIKNGSFFNIFNSKKTWSDQRFEWEPGEFQGITEITLPVNLLWVPDIVLQVFFLLNIYFKR